MKINKPDFNECVLLFEPEQEALDLFFEKYKEEMNRHSLEKDLPPDIIFSYLFGVVVDWREYDSDIIKYFSEYIPEKNVSAEETDKGLKVMYDGSSTCLAVSGFLKPSCWPPLPTSWVPRHWPLPCCCIA